MKRGLLTCLVVVLFLTTDCGRNTEFLYLTKDTPTRSISTNHTLKQIKKKGGADFLWVISNSVGMDFHVANVVRGTEAFMVEVRKRAGWDWKMGVMSTDAKDEPYAGFPGQPALNHTTTNAADIFRDALKRLGSRGDRVQRPFAAIQKQLTLHPDFLREDAALIVIFVTDGPERSGIAAADFLKFLVKKKTYLGNILAYGAFASNLQWGCKATNEPWKYAGSTYENLIKTTKGDGHHLCFNFGPTLANVGKDIITRVLRPHVPLKDRPLPKSIHVTYKGKEVPAGAPKSGGHWFYEFDLNRIVFHDFSFAPGDEEQVTVSYDVAQ